MNRAKTWAKFYCYAIERVHPNATWHDCADCADTMMEIFESRFPEAFKENIRRPLEIVIPPIHNSTIKVIKSKKSKKMRSK